MSETKVQPSRAVVYSAKDLQELLAVNRTRVYIMAASGQIPCIRAGRRFIFPKVAVDRWLASAGRDIAA